MGDFRAYLKIRSRLIIRRASDRVQRKNTKFPKPHEKHQAIFKHTKGPEPMIQDLQGYKDGGNTMYKGASDFCFRQFSYLRVFLPVFFKFLIPHESQVQG